MMNISGKRAELVIVDDLESLLVTRNTMLSYMDILGRDLSTEIFDILKIQADIEKDMNAPPTDQRLVHTLVTEVVNPKTKRNAAQWKKEQKMRRK